MLEPMTIRVALRQSDVGVCEAFLEAESPQNTRGNNSQAHGRQASNVHGKE